jgi:hypothetical protein
MWGAFKNWGRSLFSAASEEFWGGLGGDVEEFHFPTRRGLLS